MFERFLENVKKRFAAMRISTQRPITESPVACQETEIENLCEEQVS